MKHKKIYQQFKQTTKRYILTQKKSWHCMETDVIENDGRRPKDGDEQRKQYRRMPQTSNEFRR